MLQQVSKCLGTKAQVVWTCDAAHCSLERDLLDRESERLLHELMEYAPPSCGLGLMVQVGTATVTTHHIIDVREETQHKQTSRGAGGKLPNVPRGPVAERERVFDTQSSAQSMSKAASNAEFRFLAVLRG